MEILNRSKEIIKKIKKAKTIYITAHKNIDLDALASIVTMNHICRKYKKTSYVIIEDIHLEKAVENAFNLVENVMIKKVEEIKNPNSEKDLLIVVDTNKIDTIQSGKLLEIFNNILIIDHHDTNSETIDNALKIIEKNTSSTSEMLSFFLIKNNIKITKQIATLLLSGITLDTNNYTLKTSNKTFYASYFLSQEGANPKEVQYILKQELNEYIERQKIITNVKIIDGIAIAKGTENTYFKREELAKAADTILFFNNIEASFVIGKLNKSTIGISARSMGKVEVQEIMEKFSGGGDKYNAASIIENKSIKEVEKELKKNILEEEDNESNISKRPKKPREKRGNQGS